MHIKTLAEILAENTDTKSTKTSAKKKPQKQPKTPIGTARNFRTPESIANTKSSRKSSRILYQQQNPQDEPDLYVDSNKEDNIDTLASTSTELTPKKKRKSKPFHPASTYRSKSTALHLAKPVDGQTVKQILAEVKDNPTIESSDPLSSLEGTVDENEPVSTTRSTTVTIDNLPEALKAYLKTPEQRQAEKEDIKANSRLRWLAFYYLSRREHSAGELRQKLLDKEQDPQKIEELLKEFSEKGYQSEYRTALMLIREGIRKRRGRVRIKNEFYQRKVAIPANIDELIDMAMEESEAFVDVISENELVEGVDWLRLAVEARVKKYGAQIPIEPKVKARQLRFLQYRGFKPDICFQAIQHNLDDLEERF